MDKTKDSFRPVEAAQPGAAGLRQLLSERGVQVRYWAVWVWKGWVMIKRVVRLGQRGLCQLPGNQMCRVVAGASCEWFDGLRQDRGRGLRGRAGADMARRRLAAKEHLQLV